MKMGVCLGNFLLLFLLPTMLFAPANAIENYQQGRFQLFQGTFTVIDSKNNRSDKEVAVFLIDTATGKVKRYITGLDADGHVVEKWIEIEDSKQGK